MRRRDFLASLGLAGGSLLLPSLYPRAMANDQAPQRLLVLFTTNGCVHRRWRMRPDGVGEDQDFTLDLTTQAEDAFSECLRPLYRHRDRLLVVDGVSNLTAMADPRGSAQHDVGHISALTGSELSGLGLSQHASVDQLIAAKIRRPDRLSSIEAGISGSLQPISYTEANAPLPTMSSPRQVWQRMFGPSRAGDDLGLATKQTSVLAATRAQYERLAFRMSSRDRDKLQQHQARLFDLEQQFAGMSTLRCADAASVYPDDNELSYVAHLRQITDLMAVAFSCDITRVFSMYLPYMPSSMVGGRANEDLHDRYAHGSEYDPESMQVMTNHYARHASQLATIMDTLAAIPEGAESMLDHTTILWANELGDGEHGYAPVPFLVAGRSSRALRMGRYVRLRPTNAPPRNWSPPPGNEGQVLAGQPHQKLLVSVAQSFGVETSSVGSSSLVAEDGASIDLTGPLQELAG